LPTTTLTESASRLLSQTFSSFRPTATSLPRAFREKSKVQYNGGGFNTVATDTIAGKTSSRLISAITFLN
jgi:hypothetical protein